MRKLILFYRKFNNPFPLWVAERRKEAHALRRAMPQRIRVRGILLVILFGFQSLALAELNVWLGFKVKPGEKSNLGIQKFVPSEIDISKVELARKIQEVIRQDLAFTRYFNIALDYFDMWKSEAERNAFIEKGLVDILLTGNMRVVGSQIILKAELVELASGKAIFSKIFNGAVDNYRALAHEISDKVVESKGEKGIAHSKIVFTNNSSGNKEIYVVDYDGYNLKKLTNDRSINILPKWTRNGKGIAYTTYKYGNPDLFIMDIDGSNKRPLSEFQGINVTPSFSKDGNTMALTLSRGKTPNIYLMDLSSKILKQLTRGSSINTSPCFSPDKDSIVFVSDRAGKPQMYITDIEGINVRRIQTNGYTDSPSWSPGNDLIAFSMNPSGKELFDIYVYSILSEQVAQVTYGNGSNESPSFSPDGRFIVFTSKRGPKSYLYMILRDGSWQRLVTDVRGNSFTPNWGP